MSRPEHYKKLGDIFIFFACVFAFLMLFSNLDAHPYEISENSDGLQHPAGEVKVNFYQGPCSEAQAVLIEQSIAYVLHSAKTPENTFKYLGRTPFPGWDWDFDKIFTVDCALPATMSEVKRYGEYYPAHSCPTNVVGLVCDDGSTRYLIDCGIRINVATPDWRIKGIVLIELGHCLHNLDHSDVPGAVMHEGFNTEFSAQYLETWQPDDWCGIRSQRNVGDQEVTVDDRSWAHIPKAWSIKYQAYYSTVFVPFLLFPGAYTQIKPWEVCE